MTGNSRAAAFLSIFVLAAWCGGTAAEPVTIFVSPEGNDGWSGRAAEHRGNDGPFASVARARDEARRIHGNSPVTVILAGGRYVMAEPLVLTPEDSGSEAAPVTYAAEEGKEAILSGGVRVTGWQNVGANRWQVQIPDAQAGKWDFTTLYVNGQRRGRPRLPKQGYYFVASSLPATEQNAKKGFDRFRYAHNNVRADWKNLGDVEVLAFHNWTISRLRIGSVNAERHTVRLSGPTRSKSDFNDFRTGNRYLVENVAEALSEPGEWYLDRKAGTLTYLSMPGEDPNRDEVIAPRVETLLEIRGDAAGRKWVRHVNFRGITFAETNWVNPPQGYSSFQSESTLGGTISLNGARDVTFDGCAVTRTGAHGIDMAGACQNVRVENCDLWDLGAGGIKVGEMRIPADRELVTRGNVIRNNTFAHLGRFQPAGCAVLIFQSSDNTVEHNDVWDQYYTAFSVGWSWGYRPTEAHNNTIAWNHARQIGQGVLSDMGAFYSLGLSEGTTVHHNLFHDIESFDYGGWGIYFDEGSTGVVAENNIVYNTKTGGFHQHYGENNVLRNNVFAFAREQQLQRSKIEPHLSFTFERNIVYWKPGEGPLFSDKNDWTPEIKKGQRINVYTGKQQFGPTDWSGATLKMDYNCYWDGGKEPVEFGRYTRKEWREMGQDVHSIFTDPMFVAPERGDFRLRPETPTKQIGFVPIDLSGVGRQTASRAGRVPAEAARAFPTPVKPPAMPIEDDFEESEVGQPPAGATVNNGGDKASIKVTDETAATGKHSLKFTDAAGLQQRYNPHLYYVPKYQGGVVRGSFALRLDPGASVQHEWRDNARPYHVGPSVRIDAGKEGSAKLTAHGKPLMEIPAGKWVGIEITCHLGDDADGRYDLTVTLPGKEPRRFAGLPCDGKFKSLYWLGFMSPADAAAVYYLDDLAIVPDVGKGRGAR